MLQKGHQKRGAHSHHSHRHHRAVEIEEIEEPEDDTPKQCLGPSCVNHARQGSKYCSEECGMKLAKRYILV